MIERPAVIAGFVAYTLRYVAFMSERGKAIRDEDVIYASAPFMQYRDRMVEDASRVLLRLERDGLIHNVGTGRSPALRRWMVTKAGVEAIRPATDDDPKRHASST